MDSSFILETKIDAHRSLIISGEPGITRADDLDAQRFPQGGKFYIRERDNRLPDAQGTYVIANAGSLRAAERLVALFHSAATPPSAPRISVIADAETGIN